MSRKKRRFEELEANASKPKENISYRDPFQEKVGTRVEEIGARLCNHCYTSPITVAASLHWLSTCRDAFLFEDCVEDSPLRHELTVEKVRSVDGWITVPDRPGLGVTLNEEFVRAHLVAESR